MIDEMYMLFSAPECIPCRAARDYLKSSSLDLTIIHFHIRPDVFKIYNVKSTPALVVASRSTLDGRIVATGLNEIIEYVNSLTYFDVSEPIRSEEE